MSQLKNSEGITAHLQRIFYYGDDLKETSRVNSFLDYLSARINSFTQKPYDLGARSLYRYIGGEQHLPFDLIIPLVDWSADEKLIADYNILPSAEAKEKLKIKRETLIREKEKLESKLLLIETQIEGAEQLPLIKHKKNRRVYA